MHNETILHFTFVFLYRTRRLSVSLLMNPSHVTRISCVDPSIIPTDYSSPGGGAGGSCQVLGFLLEILLLILRPDRLASVIHV